MLERFEALKKRYDELQGLLSDPKVVADRSTYQKYAKELSGIGDMVKRYQQYLKISRHADEVQAMLKEAGHDKELLSLAQEELADLKKQKASLQKELEDMLLEDDPDANKDVIMEIRAGTGGVEASLFAAELYRMYSRYAASKGWACEPMGASVNEAGGFKEVAFSVEGNNVYRCLKYESGVHRVQRVPKTEASGRIHTSAVSVAVLPEAEDVDLDIDAKDLKIDVFRAGGPGGQGVNTTDSAVRITHLPTNTVVTCQDERSQIKNKAKAMKVLRARILDNMRSKRVNEIAAKRRTQIGTGDRSEKIRTYNFPDRRVTDHRIGLTVHNIDEVLEGGLDKIIDALLKADRNARINDAGKNQ
jgi:peptide chain release factor 1